MKTAWSLAFAPDGRLFFTEPVGRLSAMTIGSAPQVLLDISGQTEGHEGGLTGMALDPGFESNGLVYAHYCMTTTMTCRVVRIVVNDGSATIDKVLLEYPVTAFDHTGGRLKVGPDGLLYLTTGDHDNPATAQDPASFNGKILRMNLDGTAAVGNPDPQNPYVYALGLRDPQGIAWDSSGALYATDNGPVSNDEVDLIQAGGNYGWPNCVGACGNPQYIDPVKLFNGSNSMPPSGATFYVGSTIPGWKGSFLFAVMGLANNPEAHQVHQLVFNGPGGKQVVFEQELWKNQFGRIRDVAEGPDGALYFSTCNRTSTSSAPAPNDDRIIRAAPAGH